MSKLRTQAKSLDTGAKGRQHADYDPEDDSFTRQADDDDQDSADSESEEVQNHGREHYEVVGKSKLRKAERTKLDEKKYGGQAVSRSKIFKDDADLDALAPVEDNDEDDPFGSRKPVAQSGNEDEALSGSDIEIDDHDVDGDVASDEEIDSDEAFEEGEENKFRGKGFVFRGSGKDSKALPSAADNTSSQISNDEDNSSEDEASDLNMEDMDGVEDETDEEDDDDVDSEDDSGSELEDENDKDEDDKDLTARPHPSGLKTSASSDRAALKALISSDTATLASSLSASLSADAKKGAAVKRQYQTFDRLLDARIKLQKGLNVAQDLATQNNNTSADGEAQAAVQKAEKAALKLYSTIESIRYAILEANDKTSTTNQNSANKKRKRSPVTSTTTTLNLWTRMSELETESTPYRNQILDKWSTKTRSAIPIHMSSSSMTSKQHSSDSQPKLSAILSNYLSSETPKILAATTITVPTTDDDTLHPSPQKKFKHDDTTFYQSLLRDLIATRSRSSTSTTTTTTPLATSLSTTTKLHPSGTASNPYKRIDTKASKGRKIRYTVHEKLENFVAAEGRGNSVGQWNEGAVREFFASLLGQRGILQEAEVEEGAGEDEDEDGDRDRDGDGVNGREVEALRLFRT